MKRDDRSPEAYRADVSGMQSQLLEQLRDLIFEVAPKIEEGIQHGMLDYPGLANLGAQKHYVSLYVRPAVLARHKQAFAHMNCGKSCLRFRKTDEVDPKAIRSLLEDVLRTRANED